MDWMVFAIFGWALALFFMLAYLAAQSKLDDLRIELRVTQKLAAHRQERAVQKLGGYSNGKT